MVRGGGAEVGDALGAAPRQAELSCGKTRGVGRLAGSIEVWRKGSVEGFRPRRPVAALRGEGGQRDPGLLHLGGHLVERLSHDLVLDADGRRREPDRVRELGIGRGVGGRREARERLLGGVTRGELAGLEAQVERKARREQG